MGLTITDGAKLLKNGYSLSDLKELNTVLEKNPDNGNDIIELAKKLKFPDLKSALTLFNVSAQSDDSGNDNSEDDDNDSGDQGENHNDNSSDDDHQKVDNVDYKKLYEDEKQLRESIQKANQNRDVSGAKDKKTPYELALEIAADVLN